MKRIRNINPQEYGWAHTLRSDGWTQGEIARILERSQSAVSNMLKAASWSEFVARRETRTLKAGIVHMRGRAAYHNGIHLILVFILGLIIFLFMAAEKNL